MSTSCCADNCTMGGESRITVIQDGPIVDTMGPGILRIERSLPPQVLSVVCVLDFLASHKCRDQLATNEKRIGGDRTQHVGIHS